MYSPDSARNLYVELLASRQLEATIDQWDERLATVRELPVTRWQRRRHAFQRAAVVAASTRIEGNAMSLTDADRLLGGQRVEGPARDEREIRNYAQAYDLTASIREHEAFVWHESVLQRLNALVMRGLEHDTGGAYRSGPVAPGDRFFTAPEWTRVPPLVEALLAWLRRTDAHPLVRVALLHLNLVGIHPWFDGNGRTTRLACQLDLSASVTSPGWACLEIALAEGQEDYFRRIRETLGMSWDPHTRRVTEWVEWYAGVQADALRCALEVDEAERRDIVVITGALESRGQNVDWGPVIMTAAYGAFGAGSIADIYGLSDSAARAMLGRLVDAGWLERHGQTRGRTYRATDLVARLELEAPAKARQAAGSL